MPNTPMSDLDPKVKELLEAARHVVDTGERNGLYRLGNAIAAFDPPKPEKEYTMPEWDDFVRVNSSITGGKAEEGKPYETWGWVLEEKITKTTYNAIRESLAISKAPTE